jgi:5-(aminomethyl)-3-furanmethanol phosphate kinase
VANSKVHRCVFKLGGSLLDQKDWPTRLRLWLCHQRQGQYLGIVGGGYVVEAMRKLDEVHRLSQNPMHWRCVRLLDSTLEIAAELTPEINVLDSSEQLAIHLESASHRDSFQTQHNASWVRVSAFYSPRSSLERNPSDNSFWPSENWDTTTDTLAMLLAHQIKADRVVLLKSCNVDQVSSLEEAAKKGIVDRECLRLIEHLAEVELLRL